MKTPKFLRQLLSSPAYMDKNSTEYVAAERYLRLLYPGTMHSDASGRMTEPPYDMTLDEFNAAQKELDMAIEEAKHEAREGIEEETDRVIDDNDPDEFVEVQEIIDVRVLMPNGKIENNRLYVYTLNLPDDTEATSEKTKRIWRWHAEDGKNTCDECASRDGEIYEREEDIPELPQHPNCRCHITEEEIDPKGRPVRVKPYTPKNQTPAPEKPATAPAEKPTFAKPVNTKPGYYAVFDGEKFTLYVDSKPVISWDAVSGRPGFQSPEYQNRESTGPIPEGTYVARQEELQHITPIGFMAGLIPGKHGEWPGSTISWGDSRVWLEPSKETNTYGRDSFSIHGGWFSGSAGCIDLTSQMQNFVALFGFIGKDLIVNVRY